MPVAPGDIVQITAEMSYMNSSAILNRYYARHDGVAGVEDTDFTADAAAWLDDAYTEIESHLTDRLKFDLITFYNITQDRPLLSEEWPILTVGASNGKTAALQVSALVSFETATKRSIGRKYIGGLDETIIESGGILTVASQQNLHDFGVSIRTGFSSGVEAMGVGHVQIATGTFIPWLRPRVDAVARTQRRRVLGVGQ